MVENVTITNYCNECKKETNHLVKKEYRIKPYSDDYQYESIYQIVECCGCSYVSFRRINVDYENYDYDYAGNPKPSISKYLYPIPLKNHKNFDFLELYELPEKVRKIYQDTLKCYANESKILVGVGLRACIEAVCKDLNFTTGDLRDKIKDLKEDGYISESNADLLHAIRFLGNDAVHDISEAKANELEVALRIVEHLFENVYILPKLANYGLKMPIATYDNFLNILSANVKKFQSGDEFGLYRLLGDDYKYCQDRISNFQKQLDVDIKNGIITWLAMGKMSSYKKKAIQLYKVL